MCFCLLSRQTSDNLVLVSIKYSQDFWRELKVTWHQMLIRIWIRYSFLSSNARIVEVWTCSSVKSLMIAATRRAELDAFLRDTWDEFAREMWMSHGMHKVYKKKPRKQVIEVCLCSEDSGKVPNWVDQFCKIYIKVWNNAFVCASPHQKMNSITFLNTVTNT